MALDGNHENTRKALEAIAASPIGSFGAHAVRAVHNLFGRAKVRMADLMATANESAALFAKRLSEVFKKLVQTAKEHPELVFAAVLAISMPFIIAGPGMLLLNGIGFTAGGVLAGSTAAAIQAGIGNVAAGSLFAICQSAAAGGFGLGVLILGSEIAVAGVAVVGGLFRNWFGKKGDDDKKEV